MNKLSLKVKLGLGFGAILTIMAIVGFVGFYGTYRLSDAMSKVESNGAKALTTESMDAAIEKQTTGVRGFLLAGKEDLLKHDQEGQQEFKENADKLEKMLVTEHGKKLFAEITRSFRSISLHRRP
jgi:methyl-accepting chemotaxis protein